METDKIFGQGPRLIIELVGPAGAGKTTLLKALMECNENITVGKEIKLRAIKQIPKFLFHLGSILPILVARYWDNRQFTWDEIKSLVYLEGWDSIFRKQAKEGEKVVVLDHGPVFKLAQLYAFGPAKFGNLWDGGWWAEMLKKWAEKLDVLIWLDAPDEMLRERINRREKKHLMKGKSGQEVEDFLSICRAAFKDILAEMAVFGEVTFLKFDTSQASQDEIVNTVLGLCKEVSGKGVEDN